MHAWVNGKLIEEKKALLSIFDRSYLYGEGVFETLRCYQGKPAFLDRHCRRLFDNCQRLSIQPPLSEHDLNHTIHQLLDANQMKEAVIRITLSNEGASFGVGRPQNPKVNITIFCRAIELDSKSFETGVKVLPLTSLVNDSKETAGIKSTSYLTKMIARDLAAKGGAYEAIVKNFQGYWVEGSRTNLFIVLDRQVITTPLEDGILNGITREVVLEILQEKKHPYREDHLTPLLLQNADEIFLTGSTSEVMPVKEVIGIWKREIPKDGIAKKLLAEYRKRILPV